MAQEQPTPILRDFSKGRITDYAINNNLINASSTYYASTSYADSVSNSSNCVFDQVIGNAVARLGSTHLGSVVSSGKTTLGFNSFVGTGGTPNLLLSVFQGSSNSAIYYYDTSWHVSGTTLLDNNATANFATLGGLVFEVNGVNSMISSIDGNTWGTTNCITTNSVIPSLIYSFDAMLIAAGYSAFKDRVYFSSVINLNSSPTLTWSTDPATGNWIDVNPDDGDNITGLTDISTSMLVFKSRGFYKLDVIAKSADTQSIFDEGAVSQKAIVKCQGLVYFYSGNAIYSTNGSYPTQISRIGVQDFLDAVPQSQWKNVALGADTWNVYVSLGQITVNGLTNYYTLKFSTRDQSWAVQYYPVNYNFFTKWTDTNGTYLRGASTDGFVSTLNLGTSDNNTPIFYEAETQALEFGSRGTNKVLSDQLIVYTRNGQGSKISIQTEGGGYKGLEGQLTNSVTFLDNINKQGKSFKIKWSGTYNSGSQPMLEGYEFPNIVNQGYINDEKR